MRCLIQLTLVVCGAASVCGSTWCSREDADIALAIHQDTRSSGNANVYIKWFTQFFVQLIEKYPASKALFANVNVDDIHSPEFGAHALRVLHGIEVCVYALYNPQLLAAITSHLAAQHAAMDGVKAEYFDFMRQRLNEDTGMLVDNYNVDAWNNCFHPIFKAITTMNYLIQVVLVICGATCGRAWCSREDADSVIAIYEECRLLDNTNSTIDDITAFFVQLMDKYPETKALFAKVNVDDLNSPEFRAHCARVANGVHVCFGSLHNPALLKELTSHLAAQHAAIGGVKAEYFELYRQGLKRVLPELVGNFNADAWDNCVDPIIKAITARLA